MFHFLHDKSLVAKGWQGFTERTWSDGRWAVLRVVCIRTQSATALAGAGVVLGEDAFEARVVALDGDHGGVHGLADGGKFGRPLEVGPAGIGGHPEDVLGFVFVRIFGVGPGVIALAGEELGAVFLEGVGDVFE